MREAEAKKMACPMAATFGASQQIADGPGPHCMGADCMAWRWEPLNGRSLSRPFRDGYCGLAGKPCG